MQCITVSSFCTGQSLCEIHVILEVMALSFDGVINVCFCRPFDGNAGLWVHVGRG